MAKTTILTAALLASTLLAAPAFAQTKLVVGASYVPHAEILEQAAPILAKEGIELEIIPFQDYILPNTALASGELDANYFQHVPYLNEVLKDNPDYHFVSAGAIHVEPIGLYSKRWDSLQDLPDNGEVILRDSVAEEGRILAIFVREGVVTLPEGKDVYTARVSDIAGNPKNLTFKADVEAALLAQVYLNDEADAVVINANYALDAGLNPVTDPIAVESAENNPYANIITVREGDETRPEIVRLVEVLKSEPIRKFIEEKYKGAVVPVAE
ncbi:MetQ/NlpA family ABC transporter substrate-binding protein [Devosia sp. 2618]|uniref:MetQ/NlpA family ABC transporter substrate-binding protein n=1 Tax=Devosia sp. 2618 TaxID=3156454 RepID=UPI0033963B83